jgi:hypothetical protein
MPRKSRPDYDAVSVLLSQKASNRLNGISSTDVRSPSRGTNASGLTSNQVNIDRVIRQQEKDLQRIMKQFNYEMDLINKQK